jgi:predicted cupin superfamily sugar epimerase
LDAKCCEIRKKIYVGEVREFSIAIYFLLARKKLSFFAEIGAKAVTFFPRDTNTYKIGKIRKSKFM